MEAVGTISEVEWNSSFNRACSEEADFMAQLLGSCSLPTASSFWPQNESCMHSSAETNASSIFSFSLGSSSYIEGNNILFPSAHHESSYPFVSTVDFKTDLVDGKKSDNLIEGDDFLNQDISNDSIESDGKISGDVVVHGIKKETAVSESYKEDEIIIPTEMSKKRPKVPGEFQRNKKLKKCAETDNNTKAVLRRSSSDCFSENDSNASSSHEMNGVTSSSSSKGSVSLNLNGKTRANRGSATDPQSLYARKRRERINERLRILQNLVPNGTKVDISTMLEEAVQYVKFLQLQIKLLSSDELWMYAPIAYNGMDLRLDFNTPPTPNPQSQ